MISLISICIDLYYIFRIRFYKMVDAEGQHQEGGELDQELLPAQGPQMAYHRCGAAEKLYQTSIYI